ncbi:hypothetical protein CBP52_15655 [Cellulomonas sp. PSBB021]|nr:hypothetical protein CBP52_15655 [Cellulomonas sp. PSBB021]
MIQTDERRPTGAASEAWRPAASVPGRPRPDLWTRYPDPSVNLRRALPFGLTLAELRKEWHSCADDGWERWELEARLAPREVPA